MVFNQTVQWRVRKGFGKDVDPSLPRSSTARLASFIGTSSTISSWSHAKGPPSMPSMPVLRFSIVCYVMEKPCDHPSHVRACEPHDARLGVTSVRTLGGVVLDALIDVSDCK